jgi:hypothetical protein
VTREYHPQAQLSFVRLAAAVNVGVEGATREEATHLLQLAGEARLGRLRARPAAASQRGERITTTRTTTHRLLLHLRHRLRVFLGSQ